MAFPMIVHFTRSVGLGSVFFSLSALGGLELDWGKILPTLLHSCHRCTASSLLFRSFSPRPLSISSYSDAAKFEVSIGGLPGDVVVRIKGGRTRFSEE